jgi:glucosamine kinase
MGAYIIAIDAGGTKTKAAIKNTDNSIYYELIAAGASLSQDLPKAKLTIKKLVDQLADKVKVKLRDCVLVCGAAGAGCSQNVASLSHFLGEQYIAKLITSDARTSLYGAGQGKPIIIVAVGTGSVAMKLAHKGEETMIGGWGFAAGDLGSGAEIGRQLVCRSLVEFDKINATSNVLEFSDPIVAQILNQIGSQRQAILDWLKVATASDYAKFAPLAFVGYSKSNIAKKVIDCAAKDIQQLVDSYQQEQNLPVAIIGGLSEQISRYISPKLQRRLIKAKGNALDGAFYLGYQLLKSSKLREPC